ncbi:endonuclease/exonuclease/phosphatase family protein [Adlercreutzia sp. ZJ304]|uniref:endonuclease/exonuclease/phosphatase family protein n=1 Tax=Adlercreutzia sp. ZJ304 TaxID=2709791 RepID=UPI0013EDBAA0|nr:endonuclease/exonuclease/phosphatase family protein [Adlercreutzia sp. ZJ304]
MNDVTHRGENRHVDRKVAKGIAIALGALLAVMILYVVYVVLSYHRLDDHLALTVDPPSTDIAQTLDTQDDRELSIVTANLGFGAYDQSFDFFMDGGKGSVARSTEIVKTNVGGSAQAIAALDPDFMLFQEVDVDGTRSHHIDEYALLRDAFPEYTSVFSQNYDSAFLAWPPYAPHGANKSGIATFSRFALENPLRRSLPISESFSKFLDLDRCYSICEVPLDNGRKLILMNVHLSAYGADESIMKAQREMLYQDMQAQRDADNYVIVGGDFNHDMIGASGEVFDNETDVVESWAKPFDFDGVPAGFTVAVKAEFDEQGSAFDSAATCRDAGRSYDGANDRWIMDTFICSDNIDRISCETLDLDFAYSDHNPVVLEFRLR